MSEGWHGVCPHCRHRMHVHGRHTEGAGITCPGCQTSFTIPAATPPMLSAPKSVGCWGKQLAALSIVGDCLLLGILTLVLVLWASSRWKEASSPQRVTEAEPSSTAVPEAPEPPEQSIPPPPQAKTPDSPPVDDAPPSLPGPRTQQVAEAESVKPEPIKWLPPEEQAKVDRAIARGVAWLRKKQTPEGYWTVPGDSLARIHPPV